MSKDDNRVEIPVQIVNTRIAKFDEGRSMLVIEGLSVVGIFEQYVNIDLKDKIEDELPANHTLVFEPKKQKNKIGFSVVDII